MARCVDLPPHPPSLIAEVALDILVLEGNLVPSEVARHLKLRLCCAFDSNDAMDALLDLQGQGRTRLEYGSWKATGSPSSEAIATRERHPLHRGEVVNREEVYRPEKPPATKKLADRSESVSMDDTRWSTLDKAAPRQLWGWVNRSG